MKNNSLKFYDQRTLARNIRLGLITEDDQQKFINTLPDDSSNFEEVQIVDDEFADLGLAADEEVQE